MLSRRRDDAGFTLAELLVVIALLTIVGLVATQGLISGYRATTTVQDETASSQELQRAIERVAREVRIAERIEDVTNSGNRLQLRVVRDGVCSRYYYREVGQQLIQYLQTPLLPAPAPIGSASLPNRCTTGPVAVSGLPSRVIVDDLVSASTVFRYFDAAGTELTFPGGDIDAIAQVSITFRRNTGSRVVTLSTQVDVRNKVEAPL